MDNQHFYRDLPIEDASLRELLSDSSLFSEIPEDWHVIITDIKGSTALYEEGFHRESITIAARSMEVANDIAQKNNVLIPSVFGGDGATVVVPEILHGKIIDALVHYKHYVEQTSTISFRVGSVPLSYLKKHGHRLRVVRHRSLPYSSGALFLDSAISYADECIKKDSQFQYDKITGVVDELSFEGMNQIWEPLYQPSIQQSSLCLMIEVRNRDNHAHEYARILSKIDEIAGPPKERYHYLYEDSLLGNFIHTDALNFDGMLKTVMVVDDEKTEKLIEFLKSEENDGVIFFGYHISKYPVLKISLTIQIDNPIGIIDVGEGGYVEASKILKQKKKNALSISSTDNKLQENP